MTQPCTCNGTGVIPVEPSGYGMCECRRQREPMTLAAHPTMEWAAKVMERARPDECVYPQPRDRRTSARRSDDVSLYAARRSNEEAVQFLLPVLDLLTNAGGEGQARGMVESALCALYRGTRELGRDDATVETAEVGR